MSAGKDGAAVGGGGISDRRDRSIRLWGERGQAALEKGHVLCLNASVVATETLKNLVLPGVGKITIVDNKQVMTKDLGNNFFLDMESVGQLRGKMVLQNLIELNGDVKGEHVVEDPETLVDEKPGYFSSFSCVIATDLSEPCLLKLASILWDAGIPLFVGRAYGMIGYWRNVLPEVCVIESRPVYSKENYRLADPFPELAAFTTKYGLDTVQHPHIANTEKQEGPRRWVDGAGVEVVPKAHSHIPCFVILLKAMEMWKASHDGKAPKTDAEKDAFKKALDDMQLAPALDEENFQEARSMARHVLAPFEVPSEVRSLFSDHKASPESKCTDTFWVLVQALRLFVEGEGRGSLPLSGSIPDMHSDTKSYVELQTIYKTQAKKECDAVYAHVQRILSAIGQPADRIPYDEVSLVCKNATCLRLVRTRSLEEEYTKPRPDEWSWCLDVKDELSHHLYVLLRAADRFHTHFGSFPGSQEASLSEAAKYKELCGTVCAEIGVSAASLGEEMTQEMVRYGGCELHTIASVVGGVGAQEVTKVLMKQFVPMNGTFLFNGINGKNCAVPF